MRLTAAIATLCITPAVFCQEQPVGMLQEGAASHAVKLGSKLPMGALPGQLFHSGDILHSEAAPATVLFCPDSASYTLAPQSEVRFEEQRLELRRGRFLRREAREDCLLPAAPRVIVAAEHHLGASVFGKGPSETLDDALAKADPARVALLHPPLAALQDKLARNPNDISARLKRIALLERNGLGPQALSDLAFLAEKYRGATWARAKAFVHSRPEPASTPAVTAAGGRSRALVIGISDYFQRSRPEDTVPALSYAHRDADLFARFLRTPRGGSYQEIEVLTNRAATLPRVRSSVDSLLGGARQNDTLLLFFSAHGTTEGGHGYLLTSDTFPGALPSTALSVEYLADRIRAALGRAAKVIVYVDACRAGMLSLSGNLNQIHGLLSVLVQQNPKLLLFVACQPSQISVESKDYGGGHGAFSYYLYGALNGDGDINRDQQVTVQELVGKVIERVLTNTPNRQLPSAFSGLISNWVIAETSLPGPAVAFPQLSAGGTAVARGQGTTGFSPSTLVAEAQELRESRVRMPDTQYALETLRLSTELENLGQAVLVRYLEGEENPPPPGDFQACTEAFGAARDLVPESLWLAARFHFCRGRERIFAKDYAAAVGDLEESVRLDSSGAYAFNALGIAYLETAQYERAVAAFSEAVERAPYWAYAWNNLALAQTQRGVYQEALRAYAQARDLNKSAPYIAYNQALLFQLLNRRREAEAHYRDLLRRHPDHAKTHNALGTLLVAEGRKRQGEAEFRKALELDTGLLTARHNLALLVSGSRRRVDEALLLWKENLAAHPDHRPSLFGLAETLLKAKRWEAAEQQYKAILKLEPGSRTAAEALEKARRGLRKR